MKFLRNVLYYVPIEKGVIRRIFNDFCGRKTKTFKNNQVSLQ